MTDQELIAFTWGVRVFERTTLSFVILIISIIVIKSFWKSLQNIDIDISDKERSYKTNLIFVTPVFVLLILILFSYISFSHPITVQLNTVDRTGTEAKQVTENKKVVAEVSMSGFSENRNETEFFGDMIALRKVHDYLTLRQTENTSDENGKQMSELTRQLLKDNVYRRYGSDFVNECKSGIAVPEDEQICKQINGWLK
jgi:hypothetical protein